MAAGNLRLADDGTAHLSAGTPISTVVQRFLIELRVLLVSLKHCPRQRKGLLLRRKDGLQPSNLKHAWERVHLLFGMCTAASLAGAKYNVLKGEDGVQIRSNFVLRPGFVALQASTQRLMPLIQVRSHLPLADYTKLLEEVDALQYVLESIRADEESERPSELDHSKGQGANARIQSPDASMEPPIQPSPVQFESASTGPTCTMLADAADIGDDTVNNIRKAASIHHGLRAGAAANFRFGISAMDRMYAAVETGTFRNRQRILGAWKKWTSQADVKPSSES